MEGIPHKKADSPELQIVPVEKQPEISIVPPQVVEEIIAHIDEEEREEDQRKEDIERIKKPRLN